MFGAQAEKALREAGLSWEDVLWHKTSKRGYVTRWAEIAAPQPSDVYGLHVLVHEIGHYALHLDTLPDGRKQLRAMPEHIREFEAELFAIHWFERNGIERPEWLVSNSQNYIRGACYADHESGVALQPHILAWCDLTTEKIDQHRAEQAAFVETVTRLIREDRAEQAALKHPAPESIAANGLMAVLQRWRKALGLR